MRVRRISGPFDALDRMCVMGSFSCLMPYLIVCAGDVFFLCGSHDIPCGPLDIRPVRCYSNAFTVRGVRSRDRIHDPKKAPP